MGYYEEINVKIMGQSKEFSRELMLAELSVVCAKYGLDMEDIS